MKCEGDDPFLPEALHDFLVSVGIGSRIYRWADAFLDSGEVHLAGCVLANLLAYVETCSRLRRGGGTEGNQRIVSPYNTNC